MTAYSGSAFLGTWTCSAGTVAFNTDYRTFSYTPSVDFYEETAGADTAKSYLAGLKDGAASFAGVLQSGSLPAWGSMFAEGQVGTIIYQPEGTGAGKYIASVPAYSQGIKFTSAYNGLVEVNIDFKQNGAYAKGTS